MHAPELLSMMNKFMIIITNLRSKIKYAIVEKLLCLLKFFALSKSDVVNK